MGISAPISDRGIVIKESDRVIRRLVFGSDSDSAPESEPETDPAQKKPIIVKTFLPAPEKKTVDKFNQLLVRNRHLLLEI